MDKYDSGSPLIKDSILGSKYVNPEYLFDKGVQFLSHIFTKEGLHNLYAVLSVFALFFLAVTVYVTIRMFEIRKKEREHTKHEIAEYALRRKAEMEKEARQETGITTKSPDLSKNS